MAATTVGSSGRTSGEKRAATLPLRSMRNFSKFQRIPGSGLVVELCCLEKAVEVFTEGFAARAGGLWLGSDEGLVEGVGVVACDGDLGEHGEVDAKGGAAEGLDVLVGAGLLSTEVVGWEAADHEAGLFEAGVDLFEGVVLRSETALGGDVDDEEDFAAIVGQRGSFAGDFVDGDIVESSGGHGFS